MKRYALVACGPEREKIREIFDALNENGCEVDSCLLTSFGNGFAAALLVLGKAGAVSKTLKAFKGSLVIIKSRHAATDCPALPGNIQITLYGPKKPETLQLLSNMMSSEGAEITEIESKSLGEMSVIALQAWCPGKTTAIRARLKELSKKLGLKASFEKIPLLG
jgi:glycine cleavage system regulatory protein